MSASHSKASQEQQDDPTLESEATTSTKSHAEFKTIVTSSRKRVIDETLLSPEEAQKLQTRRAYNRNCANRARKRTKNLVAQLQDEVKELQSDKDELRRANAVMKARLEVLAKQRDSLVIRVMSNQHAFSGFGANAAAAAAGHFALPPRSSALGDALLSEFRMANGSAAALHEAAARALFSYPNAAATSQDHKGGNNNFAPRQY